ncbi:MAG: hypothetical protein QOJ91_498 [Sphingomonadales bacterium]|jgi:hypothetical protein|nr:hypothetical protein [Sphingomonadales bacterium]
MPRLKAPSLPQGAGVPKRKAGRRTKPRPHKRKRMRGGISRNLPWSGREVRSRAAQSGRTGEVAGIAPRPSWRETGKALRLLSRPERGWSTKLRLRKNRLRVSGKAFGRRRDPKGDRRGFGPDASPRRKRGFGRARSEGKRRRNFGSARATRRGSARGLIGRSSRPGGGRTGLRGLAPEPVRRATRALGPEARSQAAQREMASPPSDGSQSWDKWGPVATPAPIMIRGDPLAALAGLAAQSFQRFRNWCLTPIFWPVH